MDKTLDTLIGEVIKEDIENTPIPLKEEAWENIVTELRKRRRKEKIKQTAFGFILGVVVTCVLFAVAYFWHIVWSKFPYTYYK